MQSIEPFVAEQLAAWEVPGCAIAAALRDYVPDLRLHDAVVTDRLSVADLLSHRSGLPRHDLTWVGHPSLSRAELVRRLRFLPLSQDLRQQFQYCNLGYLAAGHVVDVLSGLPWEEFVRSRLLTPLGMDRSNLSVDDLSADPDHAVGYERRQGVMVAVPARPVTAMAPAGAVNSCAADMTRWLLAQLGGGQVDGRAIMSPGTVARQHTPHMLVPEDRTFPASTRHAYGLGWMIGRYRDHRLAEHGGGIDGFLTECMLLPDDGIGVAVMTNTTSSAMAPILAYRVLDELLGLEPLDWFSTFKARYDAALAGHREARDARRVVAEALLPRPLAAYAGEYEHPGYGTLTITAERDTLKPRLGTMDLSLTHRHYETFDLEWHELGDQSLLFPLMFLSDPDGDITALTVPFEPSVEPLQFGRRPDGRAQDPEVLRRLCGTYTMGPIEIEVAQKGDGSLTVATPGAQPFELQAGRGLRFEVKGQPGLTAEFELDEAGTVVRLVVQPLGIFHPKP